MADRVEIYLKGSSNYDASVRLLGDTDTGTIGLPNLRLQILVSGAWVDVELDTPAAAAAAAALWGAISGTLTDQADLVAALALKAPLASPALTGTPTAPTASAATSTTQLATTAFVTTADALGLLKSDNLAAVASAATSRTNLGLAIGTNVQAWDADLDALAALAATAGLLSRTGAGAFSPRTLTGTANRTTVTNGDGSAGNPTVDINTAYVGQATITTLGTITTGVWTGTAVALANGGTGQATATLARNAINKGAVALTDASTIATDCSAGNFFTVTLGANRTLGAPTNVAAGASYVWAITQDGTGSRTLAYNAVFDFGVAGAPTLTTTASKTDYITGYSPDGTKLHVVATKGFA